MQRMTTEVAKVTALKSPKGWDVSIDVESVVKSLCTHEERAALLEKIACTASVQAVRIRQNISANGG